MNVLHDPDAIITAWLEDGPLALPDGSRRVVASSIHLTPQRRGPLAWLPWRDPVMNGNPMRVAVAAILGLLILTGGGIYLANRSSGGVGGEPAATSSPVPTPTPTPISQMKRGEAGTYAIGAPFGIDGIGITLDAGWDVLRDQDPKAVQLSIPQGDSAPAWLTFNIVDEVFPDPCGAPGVATSTPLGPTVDDLVTALSNIKGYDAGPVTNVNVGGLPAKSFELNDAATNVCQPETSIFEANGVDTNKDAYQRMIVVDVNGHRLLIRSLLLTAPYDPLTATNRDKINRAIATVTFD
jgi:hypothetical protein